MRKETFPGVERRLGPANIPFFGGWKNTANTKKTLGAQKTLCVRVLKKHCGCWKIIGRWKGSWCWSAAVGEWDRVADATVFHPAWWCLGCSCWGCCLSCCWGCWCAAGERDRAADAVLYHGVLGCLGQLLGGSDSAAEALVYHGIGDGIVAFEISCTWNWRSLSWLGLWRFSKSLMLGHKKSMWMIQMIYINALQPQSERFQQQQFVSWIRRYSFLLSFTDPPSSFPTCPCCPRHFWR